MITEVHELGNDDGFLFVSCPFDPDFPSEGRESIFTRMYCKKIKFE